MTYPTTVEPTQYPNQLDDYMRNFADIWYDFGETGWKPKGLWNDTAMCEDFEIATVEGQQIRVTNGIPGEDDILGDHITEVATIAVCINGAMTTLTWGEALELAQALTAVTRVGYYG